MAAERGGDVCQVVLAPCAAMEDQLQAAAVVGSGVNCAEVAWLLLGCHSSESLVVQWQMADGCQAGQADDSPDYSARKSSQSARRSPGTEFSIRSIDKPVMHRRVFYSLQAQCKSRSTARR